MPLQCDEPPEFSTFRIGLFGLDKLYDVAGTLARLKAVVDQVMYAEPGTFDPNAKGTYGQRLGDDCDLWSSEVEMVATDTLPTSKRFKRYFVTYR